MLMRVFYASCYNIRMSRKGHHQKHTGIFVVVDMKCSDILDADAKCSMQVATIFECLGKDTIKTYRHLRCRQMYEVLRHSGC
ncbi:hypothetical protein CEXT_695601 [Caerostris extrusa]|uniref:Uncharacterized protein n=1 Tax=Caerostris extrusa TaxID=172846 RepID=A0AAV4SK20_CAEEX|nr:hypothetical protein CEXT_695601 [Caerostris extrusa]